MEKNSFKKNEILFISVLGFALGIRQMAMTMVMPFISVYSETLKHNTVFLAGIALGIFGLMQAIFQIPYGIWSDKKGNKVVMLVGLMQVIVGLVIAYFAQSIYTLIFARALQGSGAVIAIGYSWLSMSVKEEKRSNALNIIGVIVGFAACVSFAIGPLIHKFVPVNKMFLYSAMLILIAWIIILLFLKDTKNVKSADEISVKESVKILIRNKEFVILNFEGFFNNFIMTGVFLIVPQYLEDITGIDGMWKVFMPAVIIAILVMRLVVNKMVDTKGKELIIGLFVLVSVGITFYFKGDSFISILIGSIAFMTSYISMATVVPTLGNNILKDEYRGTGNGIINSFQYIGSFAGSAVIGGLWGVSHGLSIVIIILIALIGVLLGVNLKNMKELTS